MSTALFLNALRDELAGTIEEFDREPRKIRPLLVSMLRKLDEEKAQYTPVDPIMRRKSSSTWSNAGVLAELAKIEKDKP